MRRKKSLVLFCLIISLLSVTACKPDNKTSEYSNKPEKAEFQQKTKEVKEETSIEEENIPSENIQNVSSPLDDVFVPATVTKVSDGDTITVSVNGQSQKVRLIGVDTPETKHPSKPVEFLVRKLATIHHQLLTEKLSICKEMFLQQIDMEGTYIMYG